MKKVLLTAMALLTIASTSVFGYYGANSDWIDFLVDGNQLRFRVHQVGFVLGNDTIRGVFGVKNESGPFGSIFQGTNVTPDSTTGDRKQFLNFMPTLSAGIGYTSDIFSIGVGYNYRYMHDKLRTITVTTGAGDGTYSMTKNNYGLSIHTPVITMTAMNDSLRIAVPVQIAMKNGNVTGITDKAKYMGISMDPQIRYYTGIEAFNEVRLYVKYGINQAEVEFTDAPKLKEKAESFGFDFRAYFGATVGDVALKPFIKVAYNTLLNAKGKQLYSASSIDATGTSLAFGGTSADTTYGISAGSALVLQKVATGGYERNPWQLEVLPTLGMSANSDIVSIYVEGALGYRATDTGYKFDKTSTQTKVTGIIHDMRWNAYGEIYINPVKDLQWYFEAEIGNAADNYTAATGLQFNTSTGITWYLPAL